MNLHLLIEVSSEENVILFEFDMTKSWHLTQSAGLISLFRTRSLVKNGVRATYSLIMRMVSTSRLLKRTMCSIIRHHSQQQLQVMPDFTRLVYIIEFKYRVNLNLSLHETQSIKQTFTWKPSILFKHASFYVLSRFRCVTVSAGVHTLVDECITWPALPRRDRSGEGRMRSPAHTDARQT